MASAVEMVGDRTIFDEPHHQSLELLAAQALAAGDAVTAFKLADRRCRILPMPEAHCYLLRGDASYSLGATQAAVADLVKALDVAPDGIAANRRMLAWGIARSGSRQPSNLYVMTTISNPPATLRRS